MYTLKAIFISYRFEVCFTTRRAQVAEHISGVTPSPKQGTMERSWWPGKELAACQAAAVEAWDDERSPEMALIFQRW